MDGVESSIKYIFTNLKRIGIMEVSKRKRKKFFSQNICAPSPCQNLSGQERTALAEMNDLEMSPWLAAS